MKLNAKGLSHLGLRVTDLARAKRFYVDTLGCQLVRETVSFYDPDGIVWELYSVSTHPDA